MNTKFHYLLTKITACFTGKCIYCILFWLTVRVKGTMRNGVALNPWQEDGVYSTCTAFLQPMHNLCWDTEMLYPRDNASHSIVVVLIIGGARVIIEINRSISAFLWSARGVESSPLLRAGACHLGAYAAARQFCSAALDGNRRALPVAVLWCSSYSLPHHHSRLLFIFSPARRRRRRVAVASNPEIYCFIDT